MTNIDPRVHEALDGERPLESLPPDLRVEADRLLEVAALLAAAPAAASVATRVMAHLAEPRPSRLRRLAQWIARPQAVTFHLRPVWSLAVAAQPHRQNDAIAGDVLGAALQRLLDQGFGRQAVGRSRLHDRVDQGNHLRRHASLETRADRLSGQRQRRAGEQQQRFHGLGARTISTAFSRPKSSST